MHMKPKHPERLVMMRDLLRADAANPVGAKFDLGVWASEGTRGEPNHGAFTPETLGMERVAATGYPEIDRDHFKMKPFDVDKLPAMSCGTVGCALGLAMVSRQFEQFGMGGTYYHKADGNIVLIPTCNGEDGFEAGEALFGIDNETSRYLFDPDCYASTPQRAEGELFVADRIDALINGHVDEEWHPAYNDGDGDDDFDDGEDEDNGD
jgi:hypothetical protein